MKDLIIFGEPYWLTARTLENRLSSISFAFLDKDRSRLKDMLHDPPFMFRHQTRIYKFLSRPLIQQCQKCWSLDHATGNCHRGDVTICPICGGLHSHEQHHGWCPNAARHTDLHCTCPPACINCRRARKLAKGHCYDPVQPPFFFSFSYLFSHMTLHHMVRHLTCHLTSFYHVTTLLF